MSLALRSIAGEPGEPAAKAPRVDVVPLALGLAVGGLTPAIPGIFAAGPWGMFLATCLIGLAICWVSNTIAHLHLHRPLVRPAILGRAYSVYLSALTGVPQTIWRARHLAHHRGRPTQRIRLGAQGVLEIAAVAGVWGALAALAPDLLLYAYAPGFALGMALCQLQGRGEHLGGVAGGISHYGRVYNLLWLNDGYHAEHHRWPGAPWRRLPALRIADAPASERAPHLRWRGAGAISRGPAPAGDRAVSDAIHDRPPAGRSGWIPRALCALERLALASPGLQRRMIDTHARAIDALAPAIRACLERPVQEDMRDLRVVVVGGGLFPRTALALARLWPRARVTVIDADAGHLERARACLAERGVAGVELVHGRWSPAASAGHDLVIVPLALDGDRRALYAAEGPPRLVHEWSWRPGGRAGVVIAWWLGKRLNLVAPDRRR